MTARHDHYAPFYGQFADALYARIRRDAFGEDIGQHSWLTADEHDLFLSWLSLDRDRRLLDVACGSGGPTLRAAQRTGCHVLGIDIEDEAIRSARRQAAEAGLASQATFERVDAGASLPFPDASFDALICIDAINHLPDRIATLREWARVLRPGGRLVFTNPVVVTGPLTNDDIAIRSSIGFFLFVPRDYDEAVLRDVGFQDVMVHDRTDNMARIAARRRAVRDAHAAELRTVEGETAFENEQRFLGVASRLATTRSLSRLAFQAHR